ncbi:hypothetical protein ASE01_15145 [Nocardioides sp. Root190]|nr:hypothetical protein ASE01_15145 [Nocardioides sp. Root190]
MALLLVVVVVNLPVVHQAWQQWRIDRSGVHVTAEVTDTDVLREASDPSYVVRFRLPEDIDPEAGTWPAEVDRASWQRAEESGEIGVTVLRDQPSAQRVDGERTSRVGFVIIGIVDLVLVLLLLVLWRVRRRPMTSEVIASDPSVG